MPGLRSLPSVDKLIQSEGGSDFQGRFGRSLTLEAIRAVLDQVRGEYKDRSEVPGEKVLLRRVEQTLEEWLQPPIQAVINATGVIIHTNLGRAPLSSASMAECEQISRRYSSLEYDLDKGQRGSREAGIERLITRLTGAERALVVNNNAAALLLVLSCLARRRGVVISRSQLIEIGGGFRVPEVMKQSGARLIEIGTTNRVHRADYEQALAEKPAGILHAHHSNFKMIGFTQEPELSELAEVAHQAGLWMVDDLGSGAVLDTARYGIAHEPTVQESLQAGCDLVCFSGDKLLGGPQCGIITGQAELVGRLSKHPLARALRPDKMILAALAGTIQHYLKDEAEREIPVWRMIAMPVATIESRVLSWQKALKAEGVTAEIKPGFSTIGGGSMPGETMPTCLLAIQTKRADSFLKRLRLCRPAVIARIEADRVVFDPRTVHPDEDPLLLKAIEATFLDTAQPKV